MLLPPLLLLCLLWWWWWWWWWLLLYILLQLTLFSWFLLCHVSANSLSLKTLLSLALVLYGVRLNVLHWSFWSLIYTPYFKCLFLLTVYFSILCPHSTWSTGTAIMIKIHSLLSFSKKAVLDLLCLSILSV